MLACLVPNLGMTSFLITACPEHSGLLYFPIQREHRDLCVDLVTAGHQEAQLPLDSSCLLTPGLEQQDRQPVFHQTG